MPLRWRCFCVVCWALGAAGGAHRFIKPDGPAALMVCLYGPLTGDLLDFTMDSYGSPPSATGNVDPILACSQPRVIV